MIRKNLVLIFVVYTVLSTNIICAQQSGTVRGQITGYFKVTEWVLLPIGGVTVVLVAQDGTEYTATTDNNGDYEHTGIPAGRYLISFYRDGYSAGSRIYISSFGHPGRDKSAVYDDNGVAKSITVANGGDHSISLRMMKQNTIMDFFLSPVPMFWVLILCAIIVLLILARTKR